MQSLVGKLNRQRMQVSQERWGRQAAQSTNIVYSIKNWEFSLLASVGIVRYDSCVEFNSTFTPTVFDTGLCFVDPTSNPQGAVSHFGRVYIRCLSEAFGSHNPEPRLPPEIAGLHKPRPNGTGGGIFLRKRRHSFPSETAA